MSFYDTVTMGAFWVACKAIETKFTLDQYVAAYKLRLNSSSDAAADKKFAKWLEKADGNALQQKIRAHEIVFGDDV